MKVFFLTAGLFLSFGILAQVHQPAGKLYANTAPGGIINEVFQLEITNKNHYYLNKDFQNGSIFLKSGLSLINHSIRYDYMTDQIEVLFNDEVRSLKGQFLDYYEFKDSLTGYFKIYLHASRLVQDELGFYELLYDDHIALVRKDQLNSRKPSYVPALDVGDRAVQYFIESKYFIVMNDQLIPIQRKKKSRINAFGEYFEAIENFIKSNKLDVESDQGLIRIVRYYNELDTSQ